MKYKLLQGSSFNRDGFEAVVDDYLKHGWQLYGNVVVYSDSTMTELKFYQAMVLK